MKTEFWLERWQKGEIGFHQAGGNDLLVKHWPTLGLPDRSSVFVPLCGKSLDLAWLAARGHRVVGSELSPLAVSDFFREQGLEPAVHKDGDFEVFTSDAISIWCGDHFALPAQAFGDIAAVYDRAALIAMPPDMQPTYVAKLRELLPDAPILLVSVTYPDGEISGPPFSTPEAQVRALFGATHDIDMIDSRDGLAASPALKGRGVSRLDEAVYVLRPKRAFPTSQT